MNRRRAFIARLAATGLGLHGAARAQDATFPSRPVSLLISAAPGGSTDNMTRALAPGMAERLGKQVIVVNKPGAGGSVMAVAGAQAAPDGHTMILASIGPLVINPLVIQSLPYDAARDFASVGTFARNSVVLVASPGSSYRTLQDVLDRARRNPSSVQFATGGAYFTPHLSMELLQMLEQVKMVHVPYKSDAPAVQDVLGGQLELMVANLPGVSAFIKAGRLRPLVVMGKSRSQYLPDVPTAGESGVTGLATDAWIGLSVPARTPPVVIGKLNDAMRHAMQLEGTLRSIATLGAESFLSSPAEMDAMLRQDRETWARVAQSAGFTKS